MGGGGIRKKLDVIGPTGRPIFNFFIKENGICAMTGHYAEPDIIDRKYSFRKFSRTSYIYHVKGGGGLFETGHPKSRGWKNFGRKWTRGGEVLKSGQLSWTSYVYDP